MAWGEPEKLPHCEKIFAVAGLWLPGIIVTLGIIGTGLSLFGLIKIRRYMGPTPSLLMLTLSVLDMIVLINHAIRIYFIENSWPSYAGHKGYSRIPGLVIKRLTSTAYFCESWLVVLIAFNRFISICRPLYHGKFNHPRSMRIVIIILVVISIAVHLPEYFTIDGRYGSGSYTYHPANSTNGTGNGTRSGSSGKWGTEVANSTMNRGSGYKPVEGATTLKPAWSGQSSDTADNGMIKKKRDWWKEHQNQWFKVYIMIVDRLMTVFIPCIILIILETFMVVTLVVSRKKRREMTQDTQTSGDKTAIIILLSVAVSFVLINVPNQGYSIWYWQFTDQKDKCFIYRLVQNDTMILNSSVNFVLYYAMSAVFRRTLISSCKRLWRRGRDSDFRDGSSQEMMSPGARDGKRTHKYKFDKDSARKPKNKTPETSEIPLAKLQIKDNVVYRPHQR